MADDDSSTYYWVIGVALAVLASFISNFGVNLQKLTHMRRHKGETSAKSYTREPLWMLGLSFVIFGSFADFAALEFGAQSIITPLGSLTLVANVFIAPRLLGEQISFWDYFATGVIMVGSMISVAFADHVDEQFSAEEIYGFFMATRFVMLFIFILVVMLLMWVMLQYCEYTAVEHGESSLEYQRLMKIHRFLYAALSGTVGAQNVLFAKCTVEILVDWFTGGPFLFAQWQTYVILLCLGVTIFLQIRWMNMGLQKFDALFVVPVFQSFWIGVSVITGLIFFGEWDAMHTHERVGFPFGVMITVVGLFVLTRRQVNLQTSGGAAGARGREAADVDLDAPADGELSSAEIVAKSIDDDSPKFGRIVVKNGHGVAKNGHGGAARSPLHNLFSRKVKNGYDRLDDDGGLEDVDLESGGTSTRSAVEIVASNASPRVRQQMQTSRSLHDSMSPKGGKGGGTVVSNILTSTTAAYSLNGDFDDPEKHLDSNDSKRAALVSPSRKVSAAVSSIADEDDEEDTAFDVGLGYMGTGAPASIGGSAVFRTTAVLKPTLPRRVSSNRHHQGFQRLSSRASDPEDSPPESDDEDVIALKAKSPRKTSGQ